MNLTEVTIDVGRVPERKEKKPGLDNTYYYKDDYTGNGIDVIAEVDISFPGYMKLTHRPFNPQEKIKAIECGDNELDGFTNLSFYSSVSAFYWMGDSSYKAPLLIQLNSSGMSQYYYAQSNVWQNYTTPISSDLLKWLDDQNCLKNGAHIMDISRVESYQCPGCNNGINVTPEAQPGQKYSKYSHSIMAPPSTSPLSTAIPSFTTSVSRFKEGTTDQLGLPTIKDAKCIDVYFGSDDSKRALVVFVNQKSGDGKWYRRNTSTGHTWSEVDVDAKPKNGPILIKEGGDASIEKLVSLPGYAPEITIDLSKLSGGAKVGLEPILWTSSLGHGYYRAQHSLGGGKFKLKNVVHGKTTLKGIESHDPLESVSAFFLGDAPSLDRLLMVELTGARNVYYAKNASGSWAVIPDHNDHHSGESLVTMLKELKRKHLPGVLDEDEEREASATSKVVKNEENASPDVTIIVVGVVGGVLGVGLIGFSLWKLAPFIKYRFL